MHAALDWYKSFFTGLAVETWLSAVPAEVTGSEVEFLRAQLQVQPPARLLDVPCGGGRHSIALASAGYAMTGVDISPAFLDAARAKGRQLPIDWQQLDMIDLAWHHAFDGAFCFGNSFGYFSDADNARFLHAVSVSLKPGARFVIDYGAAMEALLSTWHATSTHDIGGIHYERNGRYDPATGRIVVEHSFSRAGATECKVMTQRVYTYRELSVLLEAAGFTAVHGYGGMAAEPFTLGSRRLLMVASKP